MLEIFFNKTHKKIVTSKVVLGMFYDFASFFVDVELFIDDAINLSQAEHAGGVERRSATLRYHLARYFSYFTFQPQKTFLFI